MKKLYYVSNILNLGIRWKRVVTFMFLAIYPWRQSPHYPLGCVGTKTDTDVMVKRKVPFSYLKSCYVHLNSEANTVSLDNRN